MAAWAGGAGGLAVSAVASRGATRFCVRRFAESVEARSCWRLPYPYGGFGGVGEVSGKARWAMGRPDRRGLWAAFIYT